MRFEYEYLESALKWWPFHEAPKELQYLSGMGGDEEWLFYIPLEYIGSMPPSHDGWPDLPMDVERSILRIADTLSIEWHELEDGDWVAVTSRD